MYDYAMGLSYRPNHIKLHKYFLISKTYPEEQGKQPVVSCSDLIFHGGRRPLFLFKTNAIFNTTKKIINFRCYSEIHINKMISLQTMRLIYCHKPLICNKFYIA